jgi:hypothetical protein
MPGKAIHAGYGTRVFMKFANIDSQGLYVACAKIFGDLGQWQPDHGQPTLQTGLITPGFTHHHSGFCLHAIPHHFPVY